jgi:hypothetical protein
MDSHPKTNICLGIPLPKCIQTLPRTPPVRLPSLGDILSLKLLGNFGEEFRRPEDEIEKACNLASGPSDIMIILERPGPSHKYGNTFQKFVDDCPTLWAVDELIQFATNRARSIHTVTVLDAFSYKPDKAATDIPDERCHQLLAQIIQIKKPMVIVRCHKDKYCNPWLKRIELPGKEYKFVRQPEVPIKEGHVATVMQTFHPSIAFNNADKRPEFRILFMYHFAAAFAEINEPSSLHTDAEEIRKAYFRSE